MVWPVGRSFVLISRLEPLDRTDHDAPRQRTEPETAILVEESQVFAAVSIHGPTT